MKKFFVGLFLIGLFGNGLFAGIAAVKAIYNNGEWVYDREGIKQNTRNLQGDVWVLVIHKYKYQNYRLEYYFGDNTSTYIVLENGRNGDGTNDPLLILQSKHKDWYISYYRFTANNNNKMHIEMSKSWEDKVFSFDSRY